MGQCSRAVADQHSKQLVPPRPRVGRLGHLALHMHFGAVEPAPGALHAPGTAAAAAAAGAPAGVVAVVAEAAASAA